MNLKNKIKQWLFKDELDDLKTDIFLLQKEMSSLSKTIESVTHRYYDAVRECDFAIKRYEDTQKLVNSMIDVGVDVGFHEDGHSWAVVCIAGKQEYVKFVPLERKSAKELLEWLKNFRYSNKVIDSPFAFRHMLDKELFYDEKN